MIRLLAEVVGMRKIKENNKIKNFDCVSISLKVKIKGPARKPYKIPKGIRGKTFTIKRTCLKGWPIKKGELVVLNPEETRGCIDALGKGLDERKWKDFVKKDVDGDGYYEIAFDNPFLKAVISPHYGARLWQLWNKGTGKNEIYGGGYFEKKGYIELGGFEETLSKDGNPDELWKGFFRIEESKEKNMLSFLYKMKKRKGVSVRKQFLFYKDFPGLLSRVNFIFKPEKRKDKKKRKKKMSIKLTQRIFFAMGAVPDYKNLFYIPTREGLNRVRFNKPLYKRGWEDYPWWEWLHLYFSPDPGLIILEREDTHEVLLIFFNREEIEYIWTGDKKKTPRLQISSKEVKIKPKKEKNYNTLITTANKFSFNKKEILFISKGKATDDYVPLSFVYYTKRNKKSQSILITKTNKQGMKEMDKLNIQGIKGSFFYYSTIVKKDKKDVCGKLKGKDLKVGLKLE